jgi:hypothetical protein
MNYLVSFADNNFKYQKQRLEKEAESSEWFNDVVIHSPETLVDFFEKYKYFEKKFRGYGYWTWKPYIILDQLKKINEGDILVYIDCGGSILKHKKHRFDEYKSLLDQTDRPVITFNDYVTFGEIKYKEKYFQKMKVLKRFALENNEDFLNSGQIESGLFICKKSNFTVSLVQEWFDLLIEDNYALVNDEDDLPQREDFIEHRHDQSILSILCKLNNTIILPLSECYGIGPFFSSRMADHGPREMAPDAFRMEKNYNPDKHYIWRDYLEDVDVKNDTLEQVKKIFLIARYSLIFHNIDYDLKNEFTAKVIKKLERLQQIRGIFKIQLKIDEMPGNIVRSKEKIIGEFCCQFLPGDEHKFNFIITPSNIVFPEKMDYNERLYRCEYVRQWDCNY